MNTSSANPSWRLIYSTNNKVLDLFYSSGVTETLNNLYEGSSKLACINKIKELNLTTPEGIDLSIPPLDINNIDNLTEDELVYYSPMEVSAFQARFILAKEGLLENIMSVIAELPITDKTRIAWDTNAPFRQDFEGVIAFAQIFNLNLKLLFLKASLL